MGKTIKYVRIGSTLYYQSCDGTKKFTLVGIFASPSIVCGFQDTSPYPIPKELEQQLELLVKKDLYQMLGIPTDMLNDAADNYQSPQPKQAQDEKQQ